MSGGDGVIAAEADERMFEAVHEVTAKYKDALVADLNGGGAATRVRSEVSDYELEIYGVILAMKYEPGGRGLPEGAPSGALAKSRRLECSSLCDGEGGLDLDNSPPALRADADGALGSASIRNTGETSCPAPRSRRAAPPCATAGPPVLVPARASVQATRRNNTYAAGEFLSCTLEACETLSEPGSAVGEDNVLLVAVPLSRHTAASISCGAPF
jgi:hypothetical protein